MTQVTDRIAELLLASDAPERGRTHHELARLVYAVETPTPAQLSSVRRSVAKLVARGVAERNEDRAWLEGAGGHTRRVFRIVDRGKFGRTDRFTELEPVDVWCANPGGVLIRRAASPKERARRKKASAALAAAVARDRELSG